MNRKMRGCVAALLLCLSGLPSPGLAAPKDPQVTVIGLIGDRAILRINGQQKMLRRGESDSGVTLTDIVAQEALLKINGRDVRLGMGMDTGGIAERQGGASVDLVMNANHQFITNGQINGRVVEFLVDTGANTVSMTTEDARALGIDYKMDGEKGASATAGGVVSAWGVTLKSVQIGGIVVKNVQATVREAPRMSPILLGMTFLSQVDLQHEKNKLKITQR